MFVYPNIERVIQPCDHPGSPLREAHASLQARCVGEITTVTITDRLGNYTIRFSGMQVPASLIARDG